MTSIYEERGVHADKSAVYRALAGTSKSIFPGAFCQAIPDVLTGSEDHCLILHADGAGTKSALAYLWWRETGDVSVFRNVAEDSIVMNLDDLLCVGATGPYVLSNLIGRNASRIPEAVVGEIVNGYMDFADRLRPFGIVIEPCGGETADVGDLVRTVVVDSVLATRMKRSNFINLADVTPGLAIVGLATWGRTPWETAENSGIGTNGFTAARHEVLAHDYAARYPETFEPDIASLAYTGKFRLRDPLPGTSMTIGEGLLSPTRTYAPVVRDVLEGVSGVRGIIHNSGGGLTKSLNFGSGIRYVKDSLLPLPAIFAFLKDQVALPPRELVRVFNMGQRLEIICEPSDAADICGIAHGYGINAAIIGRTERSDFRAEVIVELDGERFEFRRTASS